jgi:hypothetical protein
VRVPSFRYPAAVTTVARRRMARILVMIATATAGVLMMAGTAHASSTFNPIVNGGNGKCLDVRAEDGYYNPGTRVQPCEGSNVVWFF